MDESPLLSRRAQWNAPANRLTIAREQRRQRGEAILDLTESNPTRASIVYPLDELSAVLARASRTPYEPEPLGLWAAREAVAEHIGAHPADVVITASTSEAYSFLFKLLTDPGGAILTATPSYPLLEHLAALELIRLRSFPLEFHRRWEVNPHRVREALSPDTRALVVVSPNNPTGSYITAEEQDALAAFGVPIISDEVFHAYAFTSAAPPLARDDVLAFTLGGLSKSAGLPHYKLGWIHVSGPARAKREAIQALELIADNFLSVGTPVQQALPDLLRIGAGIAAAIRVRTRENLDVLTRAAELVPAVQLLPIEGGWTAVLRLPCLESDEEFALRVLNEQGVVVHPGYFFDFDRDGYVVVSLLTRPDVFLDGVARLMEAIPR